MIIREYSIFVKCKNMNEDYYSILGVSRTATDEEIKHSYRKLALQLHPDKNNDPEATARFQAIGKAYKTLGDPKLRSTYDFLGSRAADMIEQYEDYPGTMNEMSTCKKILFGLIFCFTGFCFGCFCCCCCGCVCCCNFCCNRCCGKNKNSTVTASLDEEEEKNNTNDQSNHSKSSSSIHQQPKNIASNSEKY
ncbi:unnamed protein product [Rotaria magnacalcarata]|uniref:J domain-containing protein n=2 Tax=Rotaria magnacalcarata TaxID=392030 RepID=A0A816ZCF5_9BILA|nr:unnamed protein product [Rotaria magnacalcarata]CAF1222023.1 unnamed protein product [Rotaria magnacalcarata]CAF1935456.1 unnamed protein product [Rotaria magnacalcarata]CAF2203898.1 unnamed protein product [Rotaria magnacalcarata]CAF2268102.1 unnamed protein product [Rotaria magnacalcarata]